MKQIGSQTCFFGVQLLEVGRHVSQDKSCQVRVHIISIVLGVGQFIWGEARGRVRLTGRNLLLQDVNNMLLNLKSRQERINLTISLSQHAAHTISD